MGIFTILKCLTCSDFIPSCALTCDVRDASTDHLADFAASSIFHFKNQEEHLVQQDADLCQSTSRASRMVPIISC